MHAVKNAEQGTAW